jgi:hypothetical protein
VGDVGGICRREMRNAYKILVEKPEGMRPLGRTRCRWKRNVISLYTNRWIWTRFNWLMIGSVNGSYEHSTEPSGSIKDGEFLDGVTVNFLRTLLHGVSK